MEITARNVRYQMWRFCEILIEQSSSLCLAQIQNEGRGSRSGFCAAKWTSETGPLLRFGSPGPREGMGANNQDALRRGYKVEKTT